MALGTAPASYAPTEGRPSRNGPFVAVGRFVLRHRRIILVAWLLVFALGGMAASRISNRLSVNFSLPGQPGYVTAEKVLATFHNGGESTPSIVVVTAPAGQRISTQSSRIDAAFQQLRVQQPELRVLDYGVTHDPVFLTNDGRSTYAFVFEPPLTSFGTDKFATSAQQAAARALPGDTVTLTGLNQLAAGSATKGPGVLTETMIGGAGALLVLAFVFASFLALIPLLIAAVSILATLAVIFLLTYVTQVSFIVEFLVALVGLGIAIDYSLLVVTRWREELARGASNEDAVLNAMSTAGRTVALSGATVAIGLVALVVLPVPGLRSTGIGGMLIPLVSIIVVNTLLPAILGGVGPRIDWPRVRHEGHASRAWSGWARRVTGHPVISAVVALAILGVAIIPFFSLKVGETSASAFSQNGSARVAYNELIDHGVPSGLLTPLEVLTRASQAPQVASALHSTTGVTAVLLPSGRSGTEDGLSDIVVVPAIETVNNTTLAPVRAVESRVRRLPGVIGVTGTGPVEQDYSNAVFGHFPLMFALIALVTFLLLARAFRSLILAAKAVLLNLLSLGATFGLLTWFWQEGHGSHAIFNIPATGAITFWVPLMVFAFLFGLSMDYEVFILTRVREEYDRSGTTDEAVAEGLGRTGRLVTCAALILFLAFASLASAPDTDIKVLATGLGAGILLDATVVRALLVPALVSLFGRWNWWLPKPLARVLVVKPSALAPAESPA